MPKDEGVMFLFDVDGTLTESRQTVDPEMKRYLMLLRDRVAISTIGGSDMAKQIEQLGPDTLDVFDYNFAENGLIGYHNGKQFHSMSLKTKFTNAELNEVINWILRYFSNLDLPVKRGTFIEFRTGVLNASPIGRNCSQAEREEFVEFNREHHIISDLVTAFAKEFGPKGWHVATGGQISVDIYPKGWSKVYCMSHFQGKPYREIHFFGDRTMPGGNDHEIFSSGLVIGHQVANWRDTIRQCEEVLSGLSRAVGPAF